MPRVKKTPPIPNREKGQRSLDLPNYLQRIVPAYSQPQWWEAKTWRAIVANQPFATIFRDTLIANILALDWKIEPTDSTKRDEYKSEIEYYTKFFQDTGEYDYSELIEWIGTDLLDLPFGGAAEVGREYDEPDGKILWIEPLDGGTLFPTLNSDFPVGQRVIENPLDVVYFPYYAINRIYVAPRTDIRRKGWGMPPPEKIYLAIEMLRRGDIYYAGLMLDTPDAGILDLLDMSKESAEAWLDGWKNLMGGVDPFKIPVLYEHEKKAEWIPFTRPPGDIMFNQAILKYVGIVAAGYGMSASDIGFSPVSSGGETLAGSIRQERKSRKTGVNKVKKKFLTFFNRLLPDYLEFKFVDLDDELLTNIGRARLASMTAFGAAIDKQAITPNEMRQQLVSDGLITISIPESIAGGDEVRLPQPAFGGSQERPGLLGRPVTPSQGGYGEVKSELSNDVFGDLSEYIKIPIKQDNEIFDGRFVEESGEMEVMKAFMIVAKAVSQIFKRDPINVYVPKSEIPSINVHVPQQPVSTPIVNVSVPEQKSEAPTVVVNVPEQKPSVVNVKTRRKSISRQKVMRDENGNLLETVTEIEHKYDGE